MQMRTLGLFVFFVVFYSACTGDNSSSSSEEKVIDERPVISKDPVNGNDAVFMQEVMIPVATAGKFVKMGSANENAKLNERPQMTVKFDYDFWLGEHEVTCGELTKFATPEWGRFASCIFNSEKNLPITDVTYFDAVIYANARSVSEGYDTCYTYRSASFDKDGHCIGLEALSFLTDVNGYRLPTEAEWVFAASRYLDVSESWNSENSDYKAHEVCSKRSSSSLFCDLAGNVMEWMNDWLGYFKDTTLSNYMGAPDGSALDERVVKGGSFRNAPASINSVSRGDVYTVTSSTRSNYVGFRLAYGKIPNAVWMGNDGRTNTSLISILTSANFIRSKTGTFKSKLVFRNAESGNLAYVDFSTGALSVVEIQDTIDSFHPDISPDGSKVAFCTSPEGVSQRSTVYVRDLNAVGGNLVKLNVESAAIPRWRVTADGDTMIVYVTDAGNNKEDAEFFAKSTWQVPFSKGTFGSPQKLFDGAYHGGISEDERLAVTGARLLRARAAQSGSNVLEAAKDVVWYNSEQACNASLAKDGSKRTLFLDFGGETGREFVGKKYGTHERLLIADSTGELLQSVASPSGFSFDHSEWISGGVKKTGKSDLVVASLSNVDGAHSKIALVDVRSGEVSELLSGEELWHPCLWAKQVSLSSESDLLNLDSAGVYYDAKVWYNALELRVKMENFWNRRDEVTAVGLGSSRMMFGMYEKNVTSESFLNMAYSAGDMRGMHYLFKNYVLPHLKKLKVLVVEMSPDLLWYDRSTSWGPIIDGVPGFKYDEDHDFWMDGLPDGFLQAVSECPKPESALQHPYNLVDFQLPTYGWYSADVFRDTTTLVLDDENYKEDYNLFLDIVQMAKIHNLKVICFIAPQNPDYRQTGSYGVYGPKRSLAESILEQVKALDLIWMDENKMGDHDYTADMAYNMDHLSASGAAQLTARLDSLLQTLK